MSNEFEITTENLMVVFSNVFNEEVIRGLTTREHNLLMGIIGKLKEKGLEEVSISFDEIRALIQDSEERPHEIISLSNSLWEKVKMTDYTLYVQRKSGPQKAGGVMLFSYLSIDEVTEEIQIMMNPALEYFVNSFSQNGNYSSIRFRDFQLTTNKYGKLLLKLLSQYSSTGFYKVGKDRLLELLDSPKSYDIRKFHTRVLNPALKDVDPFFKGLKLKKIKKGTKITHYQFTFTPQNKNKKYNPNLKEEMKRKDVTPKQASEFDGLTEEEMKILKDKY